MRRLIRFILEVAFLAALAVGLVLAEAEPALIAGAMLAGWLVVALFEWAGMRSRPHYGRGLPPRYYVPQVSLPPPRPLEQLPAYPTAAEREEEATWIAPPEVRAGALGAATARSAALDDWTAREPETAAPPVPPPVVSEDTMVDELLPITLYEHRPDPWLYGPVFEPGDAGGPADEELAPEREVEPAPDEEDVPVEAVVVEELLVADAVVDGGKAETVVVEEAVVAAAAAIEDGRAPALHRLDPLGEVAPRRRLARRSAQRGFVVEVPARPARPRLLPGRVGREREQ
jgi:hypothetical protein